MPPRNNPRPNLSRLLAEYAQCEQSLPFDLRIRVARILLAARTRALWVIVRFTEAADGPATRQLYLDLRKILVVETLLIILAPIVSSSPNPWIVIALGSLVELLVAAILLYLAYFAVQFLKEQRQARA